MALVGVVGAALATIAVGLHVDAGVGLPSDAARGLSVQLPITAIGLVLALHRPHNRLGPLALAAGAVLGLSLAAVGILRQAALGHDVPIAVSHLAGELAVLAAPAVGAAAIAGDTALVVGHKLPPSQAGATDRSSSSPNCPRGRPSRITRWSCVSGARRADGGRRQGRDGRRAGGRAVEDAVRPPRSAAEAATPRNCWRWRHGIGGADGRYPCCESTCLLGSSSVCMNCVSNVDAMAANTVIGVVVAVNGWERLSDRRSGITRLERAQRTWLRNHAFMRELGLDPIGVLGLPPGTPAAAPLRPTASAPERGAPAPV